MTIEEFDGFVSALEGAINIFWTEDRGVRDEWGRRRQALIEAFRAEQAEKEAALARIAELKARLAAAPSVPEDLRKASEAATHGTAYTCGLPWYQNASGVMVGSPDPHSGFMIADTDPPWDALDE